MCFAASSCPYLWAVPLAARRLVQTDAPRVKHLWALIAANQVAACATNHGVIEDKEYILKRETIARF